jgi:hypothetical protein
MALIDEQGRLFGRFNVVDAILVIALAGILPGAYLAAVMFREAPATLTTIKPTTLSQGTNALVELSGERFRPYMRVSFGVVQATNFQYYSPTQAFVPLHPALEPGRYDIVLYDHAREVARIPNGLTVTGPPRPAQVRLQVSGAFTGLTPELAAQIVVGISVDAPENSALFITQVGASRPAISRVRITDSLTTSTPMPGLVEVPATTVMTCPTQITPDGTIRCATGGVIIAPDVHLTVNGPAGRQLFRVERIDAVLPPEASR